MINSYIYKILRYSGLPYIFKNLIQKNKVTILLFHDIDTEIGEKQIEYLKRNYNIISLQDYIKAVEKRSKLPKNSLIITFDDGHIKNYDLLKIFKQFNIPATIFLCAGLINTNKHFWGSKKVEGHTIDELKKFPNDLRLDILKSKIQFDLDHEYEQPQVLQKNQIEEMIPFIDFQSHTMYHPILTTCNNEESMNEILRSKEILENEYGLKINTISYPNGDYSDREIHYSKMAGYKYGITVDHGFNTIKSDPFRLKRISTNDTSDWNEFIVKTSGVWSFLKTLNGRFQNHGYKNIKYD